MWGGRDSRVDMGMGGLGTGPREVMVRPTDEPCRTGVLTESEDVGVVRARVIEWAARALSAEGCRRIALFGAGRHTKPIVRQPWAQHGVAVEMIFDDRPPGPRLGGIPVVDPASWIAEHGKKEDLGFDAVVVSSAVYEERLAARAAEVLGDVLREKDVPIILLYGGSFLAFDEATVRARLRQQEIKEAEWLVANRDERHDATLGMIAPERTEFHLRRYELAADILRGLDERWVADIACGTGYGARLLTTQGEAEHYVGIDIDGSAVEYARRRHGMGEHIAFREGRADATGLETGCVDMIASFETIEHVEQTETLLREFARVLRPGGVLVISTPNQLGPTEHHVHDFGFESFSAALGRWFEVERWLGQLPVDEVYDASLPPGVFDLDTSAARAGEADREGRAAHVLIAMCRRSVAAAAGPNRRRVVTRHGPILLECPTELARWRAETLLEKEPETLEWIDRFEEGDVFWDVGANIGVYSLYAAAAGRAGRVLAFEPSPWNAALLAENVRLNGAEDIVATFSLALSAETSPGTLFMRATEAASAGSSFGAPIGEFGERFEPQFRQAALGVRIDDMVLWGAPMPNRIKIDVDGAEELVLAGARTTLADQRTKSVSIELDASRSDLVHRVTATLGEAGLAFTAKQHSERFAAGSNASIYNFHFDRT